MKKNYTIVFGQSNVNNDDNYLLDLMEIEEFEIELKQKLEIVVLVPRQEIIAKIIEFARRSKK